MFKQNRLVHISLEEYRAKYGNVSLKEANAQIQAQKDLDAAKKKAEQEALAKQQEADKWQRVREGVFTNKATGKTYNEKGQEVQYTGSTADPFANSKERQKYIEQQAGVTQPVEQPAMPEQEQQQLSQTSQLFEQVKTSFDDINAQLSKASDTYLQAFGDIQSLLGEQSNLFNQMMSKTQQDNGKVLDVENPDFVAAIENLQQSYSPANEGSYKSKMEAIMRKFLIEPDQVKVPEQEALNAGEPEVAKDIEQKAASGMDAEDLANYSEGKMKGDVVAEQQAEQDRNSISQETPTGTDPTQGYSVNTTPEIPKTTAELIGDSFNNIGQLSGSSLEATLMGYGVDLNNMTSAEMLQVMLLQQGLNVADDSATENYLMKSAQRAAESYESALSAYGDKIDEIDRIIDGEDVVPTSFESLAAKAYKQSKDMQLESVEAEKEYRQKQYDIWKDEEMEKRGRLEGYLKAKLHAAGAEDSSAGLALMALQVNAADRNLQLAEVEHQYAMGRLNLQSREIMTNFTNSVVELGMQAESAKDQAASDFDETLFAIEGKLIESEKEKDKLKLDALTKFTENMDKIDQQKKEQQRWEYEQAYKQTRDAVDDAYKISGLMGTYYAIDENGQVFDTGVPTFDNTKWQQSTLMEQMQYQHMIENDSFNQAMKLIDTYGSSAAPYAETMLGMPQGSLSGLATVEEQKEAAGNYLSALINGNDLSQGGLNLAGAMAGMGNTDASSVFELAYPEGYYSSNQYGDLQCGEFIHKFMDIPSMGNSLQEKMDNFVNRDINYIPHVGDAIVTNESKTYGHVAMINAVDYENGTITLTEANYAGAGVVTHDRTLAIGDAKIQGYHTGDLNQAFQNQMAMYEAASGNVKQLGVGAAVGYTLDFAANIFTAMGNSIDNPFMKADSGQYTDAPMEIAQNIQQYSPELVTFFNSYKNGDQWATDAVKGATLQDQISFQTLYNTYNAGNGTLESNVSEGFEEAKNAIKISMSSGTSLIFDQGLNSYLDKGDVDGAKEYLKTAILNNADVATKSQVREEQQTVEFLNDLKSQLQAFEQAGGDLGLISGNWQKIEQKFGQSGNEQLAYLGNEIKRSIQKYRKAVSGAAFTESENLEYVSMFPSTDSVGELSYAKIDSLVDMFNQSTEGFYSSVMGPSAYNKLYGAYQSTSIYNPLTGSNNVSGSVEDPLGIF